MTVFIIIASCVIFLLLGLFISSYYAYLQSFYNKGSKKNTSIYKTKDTARQKYEECTAALINELLSYPCEEVNIKSYDGLNLYGRYFHFKDGAPIHILMHGYKSTANKDMAGFLKIARSLGHNALLVDQRGCENSGGKVIAFGIKERYDALSWVNYLNSRFDAPPIFLCGVSLGGSTVLMASELELPDNVVGIISDCAFSSPEGIIKKVCKDNGLPGVVIPLIRVGAFLYGHFTLGGKGAYVAVRKSKKPILVIHGDRDGFVPYRMAKEIYDNATCEKYMYTFESTVHAGCYVSDPEKYTSIVEEFTKKCLNNRHSVDN